jgi:hypothetical protein
MRAMILIAQHASSPQVAPPIWTSSRTRGAILGISHTLCHMHMGPSKPLVSEDVIHAFIAQHPRKCSFYFWNSSCVPRVSRCFRTVSRIWRDLEYWVMEICFRNETLALHITFRTRSTNRYATPSSKSVLKLCVIFKFSVTEILNYLSNSKAVKNTAGHYIRNYAIMRQINMRRGVLQKKSKRFELFNISD